MTQPIAQPALLETVAAQQAAFEAAPIKHESTLFAEPIGHIGFLTITNSLVTSWVAVAILILVSIAIRKKLSLIPRGFQGAFEVIVEQALALCDQVTNDRTLSKKIFPIVFSIFFFVLINNWLGIVPGVGTIGMVEISHGEKIFVPFLRGGTADINTTLAMALFAVIGSNIFGVLTIGAWNTFNKYFNLKALASIVKKFKKEPTIIITAPITFAVGLIELVGEVAKVASLSFRLFGNVFAGEVLLSSMAAIFAYVLPVPFLFLEVAVGVIQALIFSMLTLVYFTIAASHHDEEEGHEEHAHEPAAAH